LPTPAGEPAKPEPRLRPLVYAHERFSEEERDFLAIALKPGRMFVTTVPLGLHKLADGVIKPPHPYLRALESWEVYPGSQTVPLAREGAIAIYSDELRTEEVDSSGHHVRPVRHTFIIAGGRYIVPSLNWVRPVTE
jgi:hypothetical protein